MTPNAIFSATHAITIDAPPEQVWPWIAQMGGGRAGWYSWDVIDNGGTPSAQRVVPEFQTLASGDIVPAMPGASDAFVVASVDPLGHQALSNVRHPLPDRRRPRARLPGKDMRVIAGGRKILLGCGIAFAVLWIGMDVVASTLYEGYSYRDQTVSELSAIGAPTRPFWFARGTVWSVFVIAFAVGVWQSGRTRALRVVAALLIAYAAITLTVGPFSSMHRREVLAAGGATLSDTLHLIVTGVGVFTFLLEIGFAATVFDRWFRLYSIATIVAMLVFGAITSVYARQVQANEPTPWVGIYERINAYGYMVWIAVLAVALWKRTDSSRVTAAQRHAAALSRTTIRDRIERDTCAAGRRHW